MDIGQWIQIGAPLILAILTDIYVYLTRKILDEMKEARREEKKPYIVVDVDIPRVPICNLMMKNVGTGPAKNVEVKFKPDVSLPHKGIKLSELPLFQRIKYFPPGKEYGLFLGRGWDKINGQNLTDLKIEAYLTYENIWGEKIYDEMVIDFTIYKDVPQIKLKDLHDLTNEVEKITAILKRIDLKKGIK